MTSEPAFDPRDLRNALGGFATGVAVVTTRFQGRALGMTVNSFSAVSLSPPLILWSLAKHNPSAALFESSRHFAVNVLQAAQIHLSRQFAGQSKEKFAEVETRTGLNEVPLIHQALAHFECETEHHYSGGDHLIIVGRIIRYAYDSAEPLIFSRGQYQRGVNLQRSNADHELDAIWGGLA